MLHLEISMFHIWSTKAASLEWMVPKIGCFFFFLNQKVRPIMLQYFSSRAVKENETLLNYIFTATKCLHFLCGAANPLNQRQLLTPWVEKKNCNWSFKKRISGLLPSCFVDKSHLNTTFSALTCNTISAYKYSAPLEKLNCMFQENAPKDFFL